ncbi:MAG TPA: GH3 auxin-responsive promoter family protein, partial [Verrucomicrobiae bacterium]|nr:GH3 auxin-responsive promoter family protein [Verrucomicrobiae bacterium]
PRRAEELHAEFAKGFRGIAHRVWPRMTYVSCVIGGSFNIYLERLRYYTEGLPVYSAIYGATESLIGVATKLDDATYAVTPRQAYYEFIPVEEADEPSPPAYDLDELEVGKLYEIVITNFSGFYRYRIGDVIKVVGHYNQAPVVEFMYRKGQLLNLAGEKTPELAVQYAIQSVLTACGAEVKDYTTYLDLSGTVGCYRFYIEVRKRDESEFNAREIRDALENCLAEANPSYHRALSAKRIAPLDLKLVKEGTFEGLRYKLIKRGASNNQVKIPRLVKDEQLLSFLEQNIG